MTTYATIFNSLIVELEDGSKYLNLCPHDTKYEAKDRSFAIIFPTVGKDAALRLPVKSTEVEKGGLIFDQTEVLPIELPEEIEGLYYIISSQHLLERHILNVKILSVLRLILNL